jgi:hypothetical protein
MCEKVRLVGRETRSGRPEDSSGRIPVVTHAERPSIGRTDLETSMIMIIHRYSSLLG